jgi:hypothetical protein
VPVGWTKAIRTGRRDEEQSRPVLAQDHRRKLVKDVLLEMLDNLEGDDRFARAELVVELRREGDHTRAINDDPPKEG